MDELLKRVAELRGMPASLVERSAQARAEKTGTTVEAVLQEWAGEADSAPAESAPSAAAAATAEPSAESEPSAASSQPSAEEEPRAEVTTDHLIQLAADAKRMPPKLILSSATARAEHSSSSLEEVLADWAGVDLGELRKQATGDRQQATGEEPEPAAEEEPRTVDRKPKTAAATAAAALTMDDLLDKVAEIKGMPAALAKRSAEARSKKTGESVEAVLAEWAGVDVSSVATDSEPSAVSPQPSAEEKPEAEKEPKAEVEVIEASPPEADESADESRDAPAVRGGYPRWLAAAFVLIPLLAVVYILVAPNGPDCGTAGQLLVDPVTGESVNCDGTEYGVSAVDFFAQGGALYAQCAACHGSDGFGGAGPAFSAGAVLATFPAGSCSEQIEWVRVGTAGWPDPTYGASDKPVGGFGLMPSFGQLTDEQLASVSLFERVQFGGQPVEEALVDCGLVEGDGESSEAAGS